MCKSIVRRCPILVQHGGAYARTMPQPSVRVSRRLPRTAAILGCRKPRRAAALAAGRRRHVSELAKLLRDARARDLDTVLDDVPARWLQAQGLAHGGSADDHQIGLVAGRDPIVE